MKKYLLKFVQRDRTAEPKTRAKEQLGQQQHALPSLWIEISYSRLEAFCIAVLYVTGLLSCWSLVTPSVGSIVPASTKIIVVLIVLVLSCAAYRDFQRIIFNRENPLRIRLDDSGFIELHAPDITEAVVRKSLHKKTTDYWLMTILVTDSSRQSADAGTGQSFCDKRMSATRITIWRDSLSRTNYRRLRARINLLNNYTPTQRNTGQNHRSGNIDGIK